MSQPIGIDLFAGAGGMTLGAIQAGIKVAFAVESETNACLTYGRNFISTSLFNNDIRSLREVPVLRLNRNPVIVFGGPPCQGFSTSNQKTRSAQNENNWLYAEFVRVIKLVKPLPEWVVFENVKGFTETENGLFLEKVILELELLGYCVSFQKLNAVQYGVPQKRTRFFAVASLQGITFDFPTPIQVNPITVMDALSDLPLLSVGSNEYSHAYADDPISTYAQQLRGDLQVSTNHQVTRNSKTVLERYKYIPQGGNWQNIPAHLMQNYQDASRCHTGIYHRLHLDHPSIVIGNYRKNMLIHPTQDRGLSVREAARLQSFPDWFEFMGSIGFQQQQVGNAVPPQLAQAVFSRILHYINPTR